MKITKKLVLGMAAAVFAIGFGGALLVQADRGGATAKVGVTTVLQNGCSHMGADTETGAVTPVQFPGTVVNSRQVLMLCNSAVLAWFNTETRSQSTNVSANADLAVAIRATCVAPAISGGCTPGNQLFGGPGVTNSGFASMSFLKFNAGDYETHAYNHLFPSVLKGRWLFEVVVANAQNAGDIGVVEFRALSVQTGYIPSAQ